MTRRVLLLYCGGTIGMTPGARGYVLNRGFGGRVRAHLRAHAAGQLPDHDLVALEPLIDSANLVPADWSRIAGALAERWRDYDGFVVLHGTDTLAYTASALSFLLGDVDKPVILTGSQIPLTELRNDALDNLVTSLILAGDYPICEVCVYFDGRLLRGNRSTKAKSAGFDAFDSPNCPWLGQAGIRIELDRELLLPPGRPAFQRPDFDPEAVALLTLYPGLPARVVEALLAPERVRALVLQSYGVGNPPDADRALMGALERAVAAGRSVVNISQCFQGGVYPGTYATGAALDGIGVLPGSDLTREAAFTKLHALIAEGADAGTVRREITRPRCGECTPLAGDRRPLARAG